MTNKPISPLQIEAEQIDHLLDALKKIISVTMDKCIVNMNPDHLKFEHFCSEEISNAVDGVVLNYFKIK